MSENATTPNETVFTNSTAAEQPHASVTLTWIAVATINLTCILISFYISIVLMIYWCKRKRNLVNDAETCSKDSPVDARYSREGRTNRKNHNRKRDPQRLENIVLVGVLLVSIRISSELLQLYLGSYSDLFCNILVKIQIVLYALPIAAIYGFLWARQRILYVHPAMKLFSTKAVRVISWSIIVSMVIGEVATGIIFLTTRTYSKSDFGCAIKDISFPGIIPWLILLGITILFQSLLLALFVIPLTRHRRMIKSVQRDSLIEDHLKPVIQRVLVTTIVCVISDVVAALVTLATNTIITSNVVYDTNLLINVVGICMSFADWRRRLFPFWTYGGNSSNHENGVVITSPRVSDGKILTNISTNIETKSESR